MGKNTQERSIQKKLLMIWNSHKSKKNKNKKNPCSWFSLTTKVLGNQMQIV